MAISRLAQNVGAALILTATPIAFATAMPTSLSSSPTTIQMETGEGFWDALTCVGCITAGILIVYSGGAAIAAIAAAPEAAAAAAICVAACAAAYGST